MSAPDRAAVRRRAEQRCEYCRLPDSIEHAVFQVDHVIARQHLEDDSFENLAWCCSRCNAYKGPNLSSVDPLTGTVVALFNPRQQSWDEHFQLQGPIIEGLTPCGRATTRLLAMNDSHRLPLRAYLLEAGEF